MGICRIGILSDIHYASAAEQARGNDFEYRGLTNPLMRLAVRFHRRVLWLKNPLNQNHLLDEFLRQSESLEFVITNGDYSCNSGFVGLSDDAAFQSARECLGKLRARFGSRLKVTFGDHELGKLSLVGRRGGMRLASWRRATEDLGIAPLWRLDVGRYTLLGIVSSLVALPVFGADELPHEREQWDDLRRAHLAEIGQAFASLPADQRLILFCHDPTALPFLQREEAVRTRLPQFDATIIGHLHSRLVFGMSWLLSGMPVIRFMGHTPRRLSSALREARTWRPFKVRLCPSLAGIELLKDGGYLVAQLDPSGTKPAQFQMRRIRR